MIDAVLAKVFGTQNEREIKALRPTIAAINDLEPHLQTLSDIDLAAMGRAQGARYVALLEPAIHSAA